MQQALASCSWGDVTKAKLVLVPKQVIINDSAYIEIPPAASSRRGERSGIAVVVGSTRPSLIGSPHGVYDQPTWGNRRRWRGSDQFENEVLIYAPNGSWRTSVDNENIVAGRHTGATSTKRGDKIWSSDIKIRPLANSHGLLGNVSLAAHQNSLLSINPRLEGHNANSEPSYDCSFLWGVAAFVLPMLIYQWPSSAEKQRRQNKNRA